MADRPVVFLGSEGDTAVVARDLNDFLWLLADGYGPLEASPHSLSLSRAGPQAPMRRLRMPDRAYGAPGVYADKCSAAVRSAFRRMGLGRKE
ncbi:hypothetical protein GCM10010304_64130 [Streptomyces roseoviolaceus]